MSEQKIGCATFHFCIKKMKQLLVQFETGQFTEIYRKEVFDLIFKKFAHDKSYEKKNRKREI